MLDFRSNFWGSEQACLLPSYATSEKSYFLYFSLNQAALYTIGNTHLVFPLNSHGYHAQ